ncbi:MAG: branched-chain amino acid transport system permease protein livM, partial [Alphaproteobacteria bacterium]|nr:branched-chain amino acid transport system permease protein livM [Alphaproteobacteria bacterium]
MSLEAVLFQALNGLATASSLFLVGAGLSLIFGVTRIINIAHGSFYMVGLYLAYTFATTLGAALGFWGGIVGAALIVGALGAATEIVLLRRVYQAPELFQLLATFALVLVINDVTQYLWGPEDLLGPRAPGLRGSIAILGRRFPSYDLFLIGIGPLVLLLLYLMVARTRFGRLIRAATQDREMVGALGVNQAMLFTVVFALGSLLAGLGGALQVAREPANLGLDLTVIGDAFVVVVVGGMGSIGGAFLAALIIAEVKALCIGIGVVNVGAFTMNFSKLTLVAEFLVMAIVLIVRPYGLLGRPQGAVRNPAEIEDPIRPANLPVKLVGGATLLGLLILPLAAALSPYTVVLAIDILIAILFATSLHFIMGPGGMASFGHAAYFGLGAYGAGLVVKFLTGSMAAALLGGLVAAAAGALLFGWFAVRLSGVYLAMLTLAFAQIVWSILYQWEGVTGGSNGILGIWPRPPFDSRSAFYLLTLAFAVAGVLLLRRFLFAPFGYAMRA